MHPKSNQKRLLCMGYLSRISVIGNNPRAARIAAWLANSGFQVNLLGVVAKDTFDLEPLAKSLLHIPEFASRIKVGLIRDNIEALRKTTWIHDCNSSSADIKDSLYSVLDSLIAPDAIVTTDDTLLPVASYIGGRSAVLAKRFAILQFSEPVARPEYGEFAFTDQTEPERVLGLTRELTEATGVRFAGAPLIVGLSAYRLTLLYCMQTISIAERLQLDVDQVDRYAETLGLVQPFRYVDSSVYNDLLTYCITLANEYGLSGVPQPLRSLYDNPKHSRGFYSSETGQSVVLDLKTLAYRGASDESDLELEALRKAPIFERFSRALSVSGPLGEFAREVNKAIGILSSLLKQKQILSDEQLQLALQYGVGYKTALPEPLPVSAVEQPSSSLVLPSLSLSLAQARELTESVIARGETPFIVTGTDEGFCSGVNLEELLEVATSGRDGLLEYVVAYQRLGRAFASANCVVAVHSRCQGLGLEIALACSKIVADAGTKIGMDQARYGLMPAAGGSAKLRAMAQAEGAKRLADLAQALASGKTASNAFEARRLGLIPIASEIVVNKNALINTATAWLTSLDPKEPVEWKPVAGPLAGMIDQAKQSAKLKGEMGQHDELLMDKAKALITRPDSLSSAQDLETETFLDLAVKALSQARMRYTISTGKTLRN